LVGKEEGGRKGGEEGRREEEERSRRHGKEIEEKLLPAMMGFPVNRLFASECFSITG
jgi:hypothetical protein